MAKLGKKTNSQKYLFLGAMAAFICIVVFGAAAWTAYNNPAFASFLPGSPAPAAAPVQEQRWAQVEILKPLPKPVEGNFASLQTNDSSDLEASPSATPEPQVEASPVPTERIEQPTDVPTEEPTSIPEPTETPAQLSMEIVPATPTREYVQPAPGEKAVYPSVGNGERWIDVNLSQQMVYAYEGDVIVNSFLVSTGTWATPTVTGQYNIYVKYTSAKMSGPGYYLPNVPYIMYFYKGYGLHGTYWHNNFGTPMSHGCVNLRTDDAGWLFNWASVGTLVNIHY
jgi:lipoprotein-anchoring transpeptidase ErfK/SrfK